ncbi:MAG: MFS transporter [Pelotomaculum sp.]|uniref:Arabinose efflux permease n=1 Tax=Pelotomaculum thermopropionicum (strain DSM 13744 / JCM 10971 / SI) TaxID=370438 RepID=A5D627_PELTS|nr:MFS transporter [Pelotomaculum sp.]BAF58288.1 arabinose efflux permease [Pelotomaculum thermopropionicum SI]
MNGLKIALRSFQYRNYRLFFGGQSISLIGTWLQNIAMSWLVYRLTNSALLLGVVGFAGQFPALFLTPFAGVLADRWDRRSILVITQTLFMIQAFTLACLVLTGHISIRHIIPLSVFSGLVSAFDVPARQSFVVEIVEKKEDLVNAIALNSSMFNGARLIGPSVAGILISAVGEGFCFLLNGISYLAVITALLAMRVRLKKPAKGGPGVLQGMREGFAYAFGNRPIRYIILLLALVSLVGMPYSVLMPVFAGEILHGGPHTLGFLVGFSGMGAISGAVYLASRKDAGGLIRIIPLAAGIFGAGLAVFSRSGILWLSLFLMLFTGFGMMVQMASSNTVLQTIVDDDKRGRVMSFFSMSFMSISPFGSLLAGSLASRIGAPDTLLIGGACCILGAIVFAAKLPVLKEALVLQGNIRGCSDKDYSP